MLSSILTILLYVPYLTHATPPHLTLPFQVSIGESTCSAKFVAKPVNQGGRALFHMETLTEIAMERCDTARCAIQVRGVGGNEDEGEDEGNG